jgi:hypothetical protein
MISLLLIFLSSYPMVSASTGVDAPPGTPRGWTTYIDPEYRFRVDHPDRFVVRRRKTSELSQFNPAPAASVFIMNPQMAAGALAGIEPPDLEIRVYRADTPQSLTSWLADVGFAFGDSGAVVTPYRTSIADGLKVCPSTMIAPGCSVYLSSHGLVYQLTPASREGENMSRRFAPATR